MTLSPSPPNATRVLPFGTPARIARRSAWPFPVAMPAKPLSFPSQAARVIATTARHWLGAS
jgi:hypothetical protein